MRIDDPNRASQASPAERTAEQSAKQKKELAQHAAGTPDQADISPLAQTLNSDSSSRIEQLRLEVQSGKYRVDADAVAASIIQEHLKP